jgi:hypothetical protein
MVANVLGQHAQDSHEANTVLISKIKKVSLIHVFNITCCENGKADEVYGI